MMRLDRKESLWHSIDAFLQRLPKRRLADVCRIMPFFPGEAYGPHNHRRIEINYVRKGGCTLVTDSGSLSLSRGEMMIVASGVSHRFIASATEGTEILQLEFMPEIASMLTDQEVGLSDKMPVVRVRDCDEIAGMMGVIAHELKMRDYGYEHMVTLCYARLLMLIARKIRAVTSRSSDRYVEEAIGYMESNISRPFLIPEVAAHCGVTPRHLQTLFMRHIGVSPGRYLRQLRVDRARRLLAETSMSVKEVCVSCGFPSPHHFSRVYHSVTGEYPGDARI